MKGFLKTLGLAMALLLAVFAPRPAGAVMGQCVTIALASTNTVIPLCTPAANTACVGGTLTAQNRRHLEIQNPSTIDETCNWGVVPVSLQGFVCPAGQRCIVLDSGTVYGPPGTSTNTLIGPQGALNCIAASATPNVNVCEW